MENIKYFIDFSLNEAKDKTKEDKAKDHLFFNGNKLEFIENDKVTKTWTAVSGRTYYHWYMKPYIWNKRYTMPHAEWAKAKSEGPTPPGLYTLGVTQHRPSDAKWKTDAKLVINKLAKDTVSDLPGSNVKDEHHEFMQNNSQWAWGDHRWALKPKSGTNTFGRGSFYLHGGSTPGSIGCIDLVTNSGDFAKYYAKWMEKTGKKTIDVKVDYSTFKKDATIDVASQPYKMSPSVRTNSNTWYTVTDKEIIDSLGKDNPAIKPELLKQRRT